jgi:hypothetical protein
MLKLFPIIDFKKAYDLLRRGVLYSILIGLEYPGNQFG